MFTELEDDRRVKWCLSAEAFQVNKLPESQLQGAQNKQKNELKNGWLKVAKRFFSPILECFSVQFVLSVTVAP